MEPKISNNQADYIKQKVDNGLIYFRHLESEGWFYEHVDGTWLWKNSEPVGDIEFIKKTEEGN